MKVNPLRQLEIPDTPVSTRKSRIDGLSRVNSESEAARGRRMAQSRGGGPDSIHSGSALLDGCAIEDRIRTGMGDPAGARPLLSLAPLAPFCYTGREEQAIQCIMIPFGRRRERRASGVGEELTKLPLGLAEEPLLPVGASESEEQGVRKATAASFPRKRLKNDPFRTGLAVCAVTASDPIHVSGLG